MKAITLLFILGSYAVVFWFSPDAVAPLALLAPYLLASGGSVMSIEFVASLAGIAGVVTACIACWNKEKMWHAVAVALLSFSVAAFVCSSSQSLFSLGTALPFVASVAVGLRRSWITKKKEADPVGTDNDRAAPGRV